MKKKIDCLFIGHNAMKFEEFEKRLRAFKVNSSTYRFIELNFFRYKGKLCNASDIFNILTRGMLEPLDSGKIISPAIAYLGTYLHRRGYTFDYVNYFQDEKEELAEKLVQEKILTIAIITTFYFSPEPIVEIIEFIRKYNATARIIIGGPYIADLVRTKDSAMLEYWFDSIIGADFYVNSSQGEATLVKIIDALRNDLPVDQINNIYYKTKKGIVSTPILRENNNLSENMVNWDLFGDRIGNHVELRTSISCPYSCSFCSFHINAGKFQAAEVGAIEKELDQLHKIGTIKSVHFFDDTFNVPIKRFKEILCMMIKNKYNFKWHSFFRCQYADRETLELIKASGCDGVVLGIESGNEKILKNMNKNADVEKYLKGIELLKEYGIATHSSFIIGFPGETRETIEDTIKFIKESKTDTYATNVWYCNPSTDIYKEKEKYKINGHQHEWSHSTMDSKTTTDIRNEIFLSIEDSVAVWDYTYGFQIVNHLMNRGLSLEQVKSFLKLFNKGVKEKLMNPSQKEVDDEIILQMKQVLGIKGENNNSQILSSIISDTEDVSVNFDFN